MNTGDITAIATAFFSNAYGVQARANAGNSPISINNSCNLLVQGSTDASGIFALSESVAGGNGVSVENSGDINVTGIYTVRAIVATGVGPGSATSVLNSGDIVVASTGLPGHAGEGHLRRDQWRIQPARDL